MSTSQRPEPVAVVTQLLGDPYRFGFFQAVRLLERWLQQGQGLDATQVLRQRIGFRNSLSLSFAPSEIAALKLDQQPSSPGDGSEAGARDAAQEFSPESLAPHRPDARTVRRIELTPAFFGLLGAGGALPTHYTEQLAEREAFQRGPDRDAPRAFYDIFQHRAMVLFYQAWRKHRLPVQFEADRRNRFLPLVLSIAGLGQPGMRDRLRAGEGGVSDDAIAFYAATLQRRPVSAAALQRLLQHYFAVPVRLDQFIGRWFSLPHDNRSRLGLANMGLGHDAVVGDRVWQRDLRLRLTFGPLSRRMLERFLPGGPAALALKELLALLTGATLEYEIRLTLRASEVAGCRLNADAPRLGWNSFLLTGTCSTDRTDAGYDLLALA